MRPTFPPAAVDTGHVYLVDDDPDFRAAVLDLLESAELSCSAFGRTEDLLTLDLDASPACLILDVQLPGVSGMEFQQQLAALDNQIPIIFITAFGDVETCARAMKRGASEFLTKPLSGDRLLMAVHEALAQDSSRTEHRQASRAAALALRTLTARELDVLLLVNDGLLNKQIAFELHITEATVKLHRGNLMRKLGVRSAASLGTLMRKLDPDALRDARQRLAP
ncbi:MAG: response regulator transcription factor [Roseateles sp.]|nr:MAG: response regulator transcription factor [Roseateles sp.]